jgi:hypothetical protein
MQFTLEIDEMDGHEFETTGRDFTVARLLREAAARIEAGHLDAGLIRDVNGNKVGQYRTTD